MARPLLVLRGTIERHAAIPEIFEIDVEGNEKTPPEVIARNIDEAFTKLRATLREKLR